MAGSAHSFQEIFGNRQPIASDGRSHSVFDSNEIVAPSSIERIRAQSPLDVVVPRVADRDELAFERVVGERGPACPRRASQRRRCSIACGQRARPAIKFFDNRTYRRLASHTPVCAKSQGLLTIGNWFGAAQTQEDSSLPFLVCSHALGASFDCAIT